MFKNTFTLYLSTVLIWGSTFLAIQFQLGTVAAEVSLTYRFSLAALILLVWCLLRKLPMTFQLKEHFWMFLQGIALFGLNYLLVYWASYELSSGLIAVIYSTIVLMNIANSFLFFGKRPNSSIIISALFGLAGICMVFWSEIETFGANTGKLEAVGLALASTFVASVGSMISVRNQRAKLPVVQTNAYGMTYGSLALVALIQIKGIPFSYDASFTYLGSLFYLAMFGSVLAFGCYLTLVGRIGAEKSAYTMVLFPIVALGFSTLFEGYQWSVESMIGVTLILVGNVLNSLSRKHIDYLLHKLRPAYKLTQQPASFHK